MNRIWRVLKHGRRGVFVLCAICVPLGFVASAAAQVPMVVEYPAIALAGIHYKNVQYLPLNQQLGNASVQAVSILTFNKALNDAVSAAVSDKVRAFVAALPATPTVAGFVHQLRIIPRVDYISDDKTSVTLEMDEYHPIGAVTTHYESWLAHDGIVEQPILSRLTAKQMSKILHLPENALDSSVGEPIALGLLPNYKVRLYSSGVLAAAIAPPYKDVPLKRLPELAGLFHASFYATYPERFSNKTQATIDDEYTRALVRTAGTADCAKETCVALTFDDGPDPDNTPKVLNVLAANNINATFFLLGNQVARSPELAKQVASAGNEVENHSFSHPDLVKVHAPALIRRQIDDTERILNTIGLHAKFLRPPYGSVNSNVQNVADMPLILWNVDAQEWRPGTTPATMAASIVSQARPGAIILMHDTKPITAEALPIIITQLKDRGFRFVTVEHLLQIDGSARGEFVSR